MPRFICEKKWEPETGLILVGVHLFCPVIFASAFLLSIVKHSGFLEIIFLSSQILVAVHRVGVQSLGRIANFMVKTKTKLGKFKCSISH